MSTSPFLVHHAQISAEGTAPSRYMLVLHGILGSGGNFRTIARRLAESCPAWGFVLVDLRGHGQSQAPPPPFTVAEAALDLMRLGEALSSPIKGVMGHSFGGKVALAYVDLRPGELDQVWVLDVGPGARTEGQRSGQVESVVRMLEAMAMPLPSRERFFEIVMQHGHSQAIAEWLAMNVRRADDGFRLRLSMDVIRTLIDDYYKQDLRRVLERPDVAKEVHVVLGGRSDAVPEDDRQRLLELSARNTAVRVHVLERAGHWVHADDPDGLLDVMRPPLCAAGDAAPSGDGGH